MTDKFYKLDAEIAARKDLSPAAKLILAIIQDRIGNNGFCWPGVRTIAQDSGLTTATVIKSIRHLEASGLLTAERRGRGKSTYYRIVKSALKSSTVPKRKCAKKYDSGVRESITQAREKVAPNQTDQLNQTQKKEKEKEKEKKKNPINPKESEIGQAKARIASKSARSVHISAQAMELANLLHQCIRERKPDFKQPNLKSWVRHVELMIRLDHRKPERIREVILWTQKNSFWQSNILSTVKLRQQFDRLELQMSRTDGGNYVTDTKHKRDFAKQNSSIGITVHV